MCSISDEDDLDLRIPLHRPVISNQNDALPICIDTFLTMPGNITLQAPPGPLLTSGTLSAESIITIVVSVKVRNRKVPEAIPMRTIPHLPLPADIMLQHRG